MCYDIYSKYISLSDNELVIISQNGDKLAIEYLIHKFYYFVKFRAQKFFIVGADEEDVFQEAMIGFYKAVKDFDGKYNSNFIAFASLCIKRQIITALKAAGRHKHSLHLHSFSIDITVGKNNGNLNLLEIIPDLKSITPETRLLDTENKRELNSVFESILSDLEFRSLILYSKGYSYKEIALQLRKNTKSIDAAINRAKQKVRKQLQKL